MKASESDQKSHTKKKIRDLVMGLCHFLEEIQHKQIHSQSQRDGSVIKSWLDREAIFC